MPHLGQTQPPGFLASSRRSAQALSSENLAMKPTMPPDLPFSASDCLFDVLAMTLSSHVI